MRRKDREITDRNEILQIMKSCDVVRLGLNDDGYPYILPVNFGLTDSNGSITMYFHGAMEGHKYDLIEKDNRASFEMDCEHILASSIEKEKCTMNYASVMGRGHIYEITEEEEKLTALECLVSQYHPEGFIFSHKAIPRTRVFKLTVEAMTGKIKGRKDSSPNNNVNG